MEPVSSTSLGSGSSSLGSVSSNFGVGGSVKLSSSGAKSGGLGATAADITGCTSVSASDSTVCIACND